MSTKKGKAKPKLCVFDWVTNEILKLKSLGDERGFFYPAEFGRKNALIEVRNRLKKETDRDG